MPPVDENGENLEQYSCDHCRVRKLRCSRQKPICDQCNSASVDCTYSRHGPLPRRVRRKLNNDSHGHTSPDAEDRLSRIEASLSTLTETVRSLAADIGHIRARNDTPSETFLTNVKPVLESSKIPASEVQQTNGLISLLAGASQDQEVLQHIKQSPLFKDVCRDMSELSTTLTAVSFDNRIRTDVKSQQRKGDSFFIPSTADATRFVATFVEVMKRGSPIFQQPPDDILMQIALQPSAVKERAWVLMFNCVMSTQMAFAQAQESILSQQFRYNVWLTIEDASLFLEANPIKLQALIMLGACSQHFSTPNLCWILNTHACRMIQAMGLHLFTPADKNLDDATWQRKQLLFWSVYAMDRTLALALGRPPALHASCERLPLPKASQISSFDPFGGSRASESSGGGFAAKYFIQNLKVAKIMGRVLDTIYNSPDQSTQESRHAEQRKALDALKDETTEEFKGYLTVDDSVLPAQERSDRRIGINFLQFQYLSLVVALAKTTPSQKLECIESARQALSLLKGLVASSTQIYNGIIWQVLYYPFTHFLVVFGQILSDPYGKDCADDLELLRGTVAFFVAMINNHQAASRLGKIAKTFTTLAEDFVQRALGGSDKSTQGYRTASKQNNSMISTQLASETTNGKTAEPEMPVYNSMDGSPSDPMNVDNSYELLMDFYTSTGTSAMFPDQSYPSSFDPGSLSGLTDDQQTNGSVTTDSDWAKFSPQQVPQDTNSILDALGRKAEKRPLDCTFDWISWDGVDLNGGSLD